MSIETSTEPGKKKVQRGVYTKRFCYFPSADADADADASATNRATSRTVQVHAVLAYHHPSPARHQTALCQTPSYSSRTPRILRPVRVGEVRALVRYRRQFRIPLPRFLRLRRRRRDPWQPSWVPPTPADASASRPRCCVDTRAWAGIPVRGRVRRDTRCLEERNRGCCGCIRSGGGDGGVGAERCRSRRRRRHRRWL